MELVEFKKTKTSDNGNKFEFRYTGKVDEDFTSKKETENKLNEFLKTVFENDIKKNIIELRTILEDYIESLLVISFKTGGQTEYIGYTNGIIFVYEKRVEETDKYRIIYDYRKLEYADYNNPNESFEEQVSDNMSKRARKLLESINQFNNLDNNGLKRRLKFK